MPVYSIADRLTATPINSAIKEIVNGCWRLLFQIDKTRYELPVNGFSCSVSVYLILSQALNILQVFIISFRSPILGRDKRADFRRADSSS